MRETYAYIPWHVFHDCNEITNLMIQNKTSLSHYSDVIMGAMEHQITSATIVYSNVYLGADQRKHESSASLAFERGISRTHGQ